MAISATLFMKLLKTFVQSSVEHCTNKNKFNHISHVGRTVKYGQFVSTTVGLQN
jgi:hypothetical protein